MHNKEKAYFKINIVTKHKTAFNRQIKEGCLIANNNAEHKLNRKQEWNGTKIPTLKVEVNGIIVDDKKRKTTTTTDNNKNDTTMVHNNNNRAKKQKLALLSTNIDIRTKVPPPSGDNETKTPNKTIKNGNIKTMFKRLEKELEFTQKQPKTAKSFDNVTMVNKNDPITPKTEKKTSFLIFSSSLTRKY